MLGLPAHPATSADGAAYERTPVGTPPVFQTAGPTLSHDTLIYAALLQLHRLPVLSLLAAPHAGIY